MRRGTTVRDKHRAIIARSKPNCHICGREIDYSLKFPDPGSFVVDHIVPIDSGGSDELGNKAAAHRKCNSAKAARAYAPIIKSSGSFDI